jgi:hypothetical protein
MIMKNIPQDTQGANASSKNELFDADPKRDIILGSGCYQVLVPPPNSELFKGEIRHPDLWLWDSWTTHDEGNIHLYCLALARTNMDGTAVQPADRNLYPFHIRHFLSKDKGNSWKDLGVSITPGGVVDGGDARNVWSGSILKLKSGKHAFGFTGIRNLPNGRNFLQTLCVGYGASFYKIDHPISEPFCCPIRDYSLIRDAGYYLGPIEDIGSQDGEAGGPILAWRDPYLFYDRQARLNAVWAAKVGPFSSAIGHAILRETENRIEMQTLLPPIILPDAENFTQAEVPKIYFDHSAGHYVMIISSCNRRYEGQPDCEITHGLRLYQAHDLDSPWFAIQPDNLIKNAKYIFGASLIDIDMSERRLVLIGPYTENAGAELQLSFAKKLSLNF